MHRPILMASRFRGSWLLTNAASSSCAGTRAPRTDLFTAAPRHAPLSGHGRCHGPVHLRAPDGRLPQLQARDRIGARMLESVRPRRKHRRPWPDRVEQWVGRAGARSMMICEEASCTTKTGGGPAGGNLSSTPRPMSPAKRKDARPTVSVKTTDAFASWPPLVKASVGGLRIRHSPAQMATDSSNGLFLSLTCGEQGRILGAIMSKAAEAPAKLDERGKARLCRATANRRRSSSRTARTVYRWIKLKNALRRPGRGGADHRALARCLDAPLRALVRQGAARRGPRAAHDAWIRDVWGAWA